MEQQALINGLYEAARNFRRGHRFGYGCCFAMDMEFSSRLRYEVMSDILASLFDWSDGREDFYFGSTANNAPERKHRQAAILLLAAMAETGDIYVDGSGHNVCFRPIKQPLRKARFSGAIPRSSKTAGRSLRKRTQPKSNKSKKT